MPDEAGWPGDDPTETVPALAATRPGWLGAGALVLVVLTLAAILLLATRDDSVPDGAPASSARPGTATTMPDRSASTPPRATGEATEEVTLGVLLVAVANDPDAYGPRGDDLRELLVDLAAHEHIAPEARDRAIADVEAWVQAGELAPSAGQSVVAVVGALPLTAAGAMTDA